MPFIELNAKQRRALLNELITEASDDELLSMARLLITRARFTLPQSYQDRILKHATGAFKVKKDKKPVRAVAHPAASCEDEDDWADE